MGKELIAKLKEEVIKNSQNPKFKHYKWFAKYHLELVERIALELCDKYKDADKETILVLVWIHDYGKTIDYDNQYATTLNKGKKPVKSFSAVIYGIEIYLPVSGMIDTDKEIKKLEAEVKRIEEFTVHLEQKLKNQRFLDRAPKEIIEAEKKKLIENQEKLKKIEQQLKTLG